MTEEIKKPEETTETQIAEDLHDEAFDEAVKEFDSEGTPAGSETIPKEEKPPEEPAKKEEEVKVGQETPPETLAPPVETEEVKSLKQQLEDTKRWGTDNATKVADLTKKLETLGKKPPAEPPKEEEIPDDIKALYEDYPELRKAVEFEAKRLIKMLPASTPGVTPEAIEPLQKTVGQMVFEQSIVMGFADKDGNFIEGHPDALRVAASKEFKEWVKSDPDADTGDPIRAIKLIGRFKESKVKEATKQHDKNLEKEAEERKQAASASISSTKGGRTGGGGVNKDDFDGAWDEAARM